MQPMPLSTAAEAVDGTLSDIDDSQRTITGAQFDSRSVRQGELFLALTGEHQDGHVFAGDAVASGAAAVLANRPVGVPAIVVPDVLESLGRLARHVVDALTTRVVAITGSAGKTSTKDLIAHVLGAAGPTIATEGSYNNEIGLPLTVLRADDSTRYLVLEMGARGIGHIHQLTSIAPPDISVVTNVGTAHIGEFGGQEQIAQGKGEIVEALGSDGLAVLNADDHRVRAMGAGTDARVLTYGLADDADIRATDVALDIGGCPAFTLHTPAGSTPVHLGLVGEPQVYNALAAAAVGHEAGLPVHQLGELLSSALPRSRWRMETTTRADGVTIVNDAYNANPDSMRYSLEALATMSAGADRRGIAVLGEMAELGPDCRHMHEEVGRTAARLGLDLLLAVGGEDATAMHQAAGAGGGVSQYVPDQDTALRLLQQTLRTGDIVLVKASRAAGLQQLAERLLKPRPESL